MRGDNSLGASHQFEEAAAVMWVLRRAGVDLKDPDAEYRFRILRARTPETVAQACLLILALCAEPLPQGDPFALEPPERRSGAAHTLSEEDVTLARKTVERLLQAQVMTALLRLPDGMPDLPPEDMQLETKGGWGDELGGEDPTGIADVPNTYMALLALEAAARCGVDVPAERFLAALQCLLRWQALKGRKVTLKMNEVRGDKRLEWTVKAKSRGFGWTGSMSAKPSGFETAAGAVGLVICMDALRGHPSLEKELAKRSTAAVQDALAWIQKRYTIKENPDRHRRGKVDTAELYHHHWLQSLARLAIHFRMRFIDKHDWYKEGAAALLEQQQEDGHWKAVWWSNCYALLFLQRAGPRRPQDRAI